MQLALEFGAKLFIRKPAAHAALESLVRRDQRFGDVPASEGTVAAALVGVLSGQQRRQRIAAFSIGFNWLHV
jgi:hypothetical protein